MFIVEKIPFGLEMTTCISLQRQCGPRVSENLFLNLRSPVIVGETSGIFVKRNHGPPVEGAASFHPTRWMIVIKAGQSHKEIHALCEVLIASEGRLGL
jgi:hypothetical protein